MEQPPLPFSLPTPPLDAAGSRASSQFSDTPGPSAVNSGLKWFKTASKTNSRLGKGGPYELQAMSLSSRMTVNLRYEDVKFWPYTGALRPKGTPRGRQWDWAEWDNTVAMCIKSKIVIGRCSDAQPWNVVLELDGLEDHFYALAWSYHPLTYHPILAAGGSGAVIWIIDVAERSVLRTLKGHGGGVLHVAFHPSLPHILASTAYDKTTRIWNVYGADVPPPLPPPDHLPNENYPMGLADEGTYLVAILAGEGGGGHRTYVTSAAFHPVKAAIATCGIDRQVKIWPLPVMPDAEFPPPPTPRGYRAQIVPLPLFSSSRLFEDYTDYIEWLSEDVLITRGRQQLVTWQWLAYSRFFRPGISKPMGTTPQTSDYIDSGSYMIMARYPMGPDMWASSVGFHRAWKPTPEEEATLIRKPNLCLDPLIAVADHGNERVPAIALVNPLLAEPDPPPKPPTELRALAKGEVDETGQTVDKDRAIPPEWLVWPINPSLWPWRLTAPEWREALKQQSKGHKWELHPTGANLMNAAVSPRGAEWIVGAGENETVFVWRLKQD
ncbi:hypothetical protein IAU60_005227 [Kwoniella sp. DSM 27419]